MRSLAVLLGVILATLEADALTCPVNFSGNLRCTTGCYTYGFAAMDRDTAASKCANMGGYLLIIESDEEGTCLASHVESISFIDAFWTSAVFNNNYGGWVWDKNGASVEPVRKDIWAFGEPIPYGFYQYAALMSQGAAKYKLSSNQGKSIGFICEADPIKY